MTDDLVANLHRAHEALRELSSTAGTSGRQRPISGLDAPAHGRAVHQNADGHDKQHGQGPHAAPIAANAYGDKVDHAEDVDGRSKKKDKKHKSDKNDKREKEDAAVADESGVPAEPLPPWAARASGNAGLGSTAPSVVNMTSEGRHGHVNGDKHGRVEAAPSDLGKGKEERKKRRKGGYEAEGKSTVEGHGGVSSAAEDVEKLQPKEKKIKKKNKESE